MRLCILEMSYSFRINSNDSKPLYINSHAWMFSICHAYNLSKLLISSIKGWEIYSKLPLPLFLCQFSFTFTKVLAYIPALLGYNHHIIRYKCKVYGVMVWNTYIHSSRKIYRRPKNRWKYAQRHWLSEKCKSKLQWGITSRWSEPPSSKIYKQ